jgi:hypothetical protein
MKAKISIITLGVSDFQKSFEFYGKRLGFKSHNYKEGDDYAMFEMEGTWLAIFPREKIAEDKGVEDSSNGVAGITLAHNVGSKEEVDIVYREAISAGGKPIKKPKEAAWGGYSGYFADPDGYSWEIAYNPFTDLS